MLLLERVLVAGAQGHDRGHVDLVEGRQHGGGILRVLEAPRDGLAQPRHRNALLAILRRQAGAARGRRRNRGWRRGRARAPGPLRDSRGHRPSGPGRACRSPPRPAGIDAVIGGDLGGGGRGGHRGRRWRVAGRARRARQAPACAAERWRLPAWASALAGRGGARFPDLAKQRPDADRLAILGDDFGEDARRRRIDFERDLVGFELDDAARPPGPPRPLS